MTHVLPVERLTSDRVSLKTVAPGGFFFPPENLVKTFTAKGKDGADQVKCAKGFLTLSSVALAIAGVVAAPVAGATAGAVPVEEEQLVQQTRGELCSGLAFRSPSTLLPQRKS